MNVFKHFSPQLDNVLVDYCEIDLFGWILQFFAGNFARKLSRRACHPPEVRCGDVFCSRGGSIFVKLAFAQTCSSIITLFLSCVRNIFQSIEDDNGQNREEMFLLSENRVFPPYPYPAHQAKIFTWLTPSPCLGV